MDKHTISIKGKLTVDTSSNTVTLPSSELNKVYIWGYELCKGSDWNDFLEVVNKLGKENQQLKQQLAEKENERLKEEICKYEITLMDKNSQLKQQLRDLPKKVVEDITNELSNNTSLYFEMRESTSAHCPNQEYEWFNYVRFRDYVNAILKKYGGEDE